MKRTRVEMRADLMRQAEVLVDELLDWNEQTVEPTLTQIEEVILKLRQRLSEQTGLAVIESQEATRPVPNPRCPTCQPHSSVCRPRTWLGLGRSLDP